jgi:pyrroline-5-carboxylate reductase
MSVKHGFIGFGNLAKAVYQGLKEEEGIEFAYYARSRREIDIPYYERMDDLVAFADVIWLMVKPQDLSTVLEQLKPLNRAGNTIVSPVAGRNIAFIERYTGKEQLIVRIMPNLAMAYRKSVTAFATNQPGTGMQQKFSTC